MSHGKSKSKLDNSKSKSPPSLTVYHTDVRGLREHFTDPEAFMLKNNPDIFALCETNLHDDIQDAGNMHGLGVYVKSNLPRDYF